MINKNQIRYLKSQAHHLEPVVIIGANGLTENVLKEINLALNSHELIKVKLPALEHSEQEEIIKQISDNLTANFVDKIGRIAIFYRENNKKKDKIKLPK